MSKENWWRRKANIYNIYIPGQKKVEVARGVIELGKILKETKEGLNTEQFIQWLSDSRVGFKKSQAYKYIKIANEYNDIFSTSDGKILNQLSVNKLFELASAPEEVKEDVANSKDKEEAEKKIKEYDELGEQCSPNLLDNISVRKLYTLASAPEEVKKNINKTHYKRF